MFLPFLELESKVIYQRDNHILRCIPSAGIFHFISEDNKSIFLGFEGSLFNSVGCMTFGQYVVFFFCTTLSKFIASRLYVG